MNKPSLIQSIPQSAIPIAPFPPPAKPSHPAVLVSGRALIGFASRSSQLQVASWRARHGFPVLATVFALLVCLCGLPSVSLAASHGAHPYGNSHRSTHSPVSGGHGYHSHTRR